MKQNVSQLPSRPGRKPAASSNKQDELRCRCHRLLAKMHQGAVVLRCPRCKAEATLVLDPSRQGESMMLRFARRA